jgi:hypothetical protein
LYLVILFLLSVMEPSCLIWWHSSRQLSVAFSVFFWLIVSSFRFCRRRDWVVEAVDLAVEFKSVVGSMSVPVPN